MSIFKKSHSFTRLSILLGAFATTPLIATATTGITPSPKRIEEIAAALPVEPRFCGPSRSNRAAWDDFNVRFGAPILSSAGRILGTSSPTLNPDDYLEYSRTGKRGGQYEKIRNQRRSRLRNLTLAECIRNDGTYISAITAELEAILSEITWVDPAHDNGLRNFKGERIDIDLIAASDSASIGITLALVGDKLPSKILSQTHAELDRRIFEPYLSFLYEKETPEYWNSSFLRHWFTARHNWNAVCHTGVTIAALATLSEQAKRAEIVASAEKNLRHYLSGFSRSGYCIEGIVYWNYGFGHYVILAETLLRETSGAVDLFALPPVREVATFPQNIAMSPGIYPHFGDSNIRTDPMPWISRIVNPRVGLPLKSAPEDKNPALFFYSIGLTAFPPPQSTPPPPSASILANPLRGWFEDNAILVARPSDNDPQKMSVAIKGGLGGLPHGHADLGQFVVALQGRTPLLDPGAEKYEAKTFGKNRFSIPRIGSFGHSVPLVAGRWQLGDKRASSRVLKTSFTPQSDIIALDLKGAYDVPALTKLERVFTYDRAGTGKLVVEDLVAFSSPQTFGTALITMGSIKQKTPDSIIVSDGGAQLLVTIETSGQTFSIAQQPIETNHPPAPLRIGIDLDKPVTQAILRCTITPLSAQP